MIPQRNPELDRLYELLTALGLRATDLIPHLRLGRRIRHLTELTPEEVSQQVRDCEASARRQGITV